MGDAPQPHLFSGSYLDPYTLTIQNVVPGPESASPGSLLELVGIQ